LFIERFSLIYEARPNEVIEHQSAPDTIKNSHKLPVGSMHGNRARLKISVRTTKLIDEVTAPTLSERLEKFRRMHLNPPTKLLPAEYRVELLSFQFPVETLRGAALRAGRGATAPARQPLSAIS
jgi:hypothetical protein